MGDTGVVVVKIVSGGQTGVDRAALDAAISSSFDYGGWCPLGGWAEDLPDPPGLLVDYPALQATPERRLAQRTEWNVRDSDATLILYSPSGLAVSAGTVFTQEQAQHYCKLTSVLDLSDDNSLDHARAWLTSIKAEISLNIAGPRESESPGIYQAARTFIGDLLADQHRPRTGLA